MLFNLNAGHTITGADTGARANTLGKLRIEEQMTRKLVDILAEDLKKEGHNINIVKCDYASTLNESLNIQVNKCNAVNADLNIVIHFNCFNTKANGSEIYTWRGEKF